MRRARSHSTSPANWLAWVPLAVSTTQMMRDSAEVIALRTNRMMKAGVTPGLADRDEMRLMGQEKVFASLESGMSVMQGLWALNSRLWMMGIQQAAAGMPLLFSLATSLTPAQAFARQARLINAVWANAGAANARTLAAMPQMVGKGIKPLQSRAKANVKRLRKS